MKIVLSPFAKKLREKDTPHPKEYPKMKELVTLLEKDGHSLIQIGAGNEEKLTEDCRFNFLSKDLIDLLKEADTFISIDSFLPHLVHYNFKGKKRGVVLFGTSDPEIFGYPENANLLKDRKFVRWDIFGPWEMTEAKPESFVEPEDVIKALYDLTAGTKGEERAVPEAQEG